MGDAQAVAAVEVAHAARHLGHPAQPLLRAVRSRPAHPIQQRAALAVLLCEDELLVTGGEEALPIRWLDAAVACDDVGMAQRLQQQRLALEGQAPALGHADHAHRPALLPRRRRPRIGDALPHALESDQRAPGEPKGAVVAAALRDRRVRVELDDRKCALAQRLHHGQLRHRQVTVQPKPVLHELLAAPPPALDSGLILLRHIVYWTEIAQGRRVEQPGEALERMGGGVGVARAVAAPPPHHIAAMAHSAWGGIVWRGDRWWRLRHW